MVSNDAAYMAAWKRAHGDRVRMYEKRQSLREESARLRSTGGADGKAAKLMDAEITERMREKALRQFEGEAWEKRI